MEREKWINAHYKFSYLIDFSDQIFCEKFQGDFVSIMHLLQIDGFTVEFPFEPYECQIKFMQKVMEALRAVYALIVHKYNCIIEYINMPARKLPAIS